MHVHARCYQRGFVSILEGKRGMGRGTYERTQSCVLISFPETIPSHC